MTTLRASSLALLLVASSFVTGGCNGGKSGKPSGDPESRTGAVESALSKPTGNVDAQSAKSSIVSARGYVDIETFNDVLTYVAQGQANAGALAKCSKTTGGTMTGQAGSAVDAQGSVDIGCATNNEGSGELDFDVKVKSSQTGSDVLADITFKKVCKGNVCIDGSLATKVSAGAGGASVILSLEADVTNDGKTEHVSIGTKVQAGTEGTSVEVVSFDDNGDSVVVSTATSASQGSTKITGANGTFECSYDSFGDTGKCSGDASFNW